jgi:hypothetical protein
MTASESVESSVDSVIGDDEITAFAGLQGDETGSTTFQRFKWQAKLAVRTWLQALTNAGVLAVVCEHVEDLTVVEATGFRFAQLKTRDKGSWSAAKICEKGHAISRLVASYLLADAAGIVADCRFEVWLEGPPAEAQETTSFFADPSSATAATKTKIREFGLTGAKLVDFLERLSIHCHQPSRQTIDAVVIRTIGALWPALSMHQAELLYEALLDVAETAQAAEPASVGMMNALSAARSEPVGSGVWGPIVLKLLTLVKLKALCPPLGADGVEELQARVTAGQASMLELKLVRGGASNDTIQSALMARADADIVLTKGRASGVVTADLQGTFEVRLLSMAQSAAAVATSSAASIQRPAEFIYHSLMINVANTAALDVENLYGSDHRLIVGHLCGVSDQCRYGWGMT